MRCATASLCGAPRGQAFDHVAREAGVSRGLLHYYFGTKEQLLVEVVRDAEVRLDALERQLADVKTADDFVSILVVGLQEVIAEEPDIVALGFELFTLSRRNADIASEYTELLRRMRLHVAAMLTQKEQEGVLKLGARRPRRWPTCCSPWPTGSPCGYWPSPLATSPRRSARRCARWRR